MPWKVTVEVDIKISIHQFFRCFELSRGPQAVKPSEWVILISLLPRQHILDPTWCPKCTINVLDIIQMVSLTDLYHGSADRFVRITLTSGYPAISSEAKHKAGYPSRPILAQNLVIMRGEFLVSRSILLVNHPIPLHCTPNHCL